MSWAYIFLDGYHFWNESSPLTVTFSMLPVCRLGFCLKEECIRSISIIILLGRRVWVERAHFHLIESICSLFSMVLFLYFFLWLMLWRALLNPAFFLSMQLSHQGCLLTHLWNSPPQRLFCVLRWSTVTSDSFSGYRYRCLQDTTCWHTYIADVAWLIKVCYFILNFFYQ